MLEVLEDGEIHLRHGGDTEKKRGTEDEEHRGRFLDRTAWQKSAEYPSILTVSSAVFVTARHSRW
jgi:hypothetical protein